MGIHVVKMCCMQKMLVRGRTILPFYWVYKEMLKNHSVRSCTTMQRSYKEIFSSIEQRIIERKLTQTT